MTDLVRESFLASIRTDLLRRSFLAPIRTGIPPRSGGWVRDFFRSATACAQPFRQLPPFSVPLRLCGFSGRPDQTTLRTLKRRAEALGVDVKALVG